MKKSAKKFDEKQLVKNIISFLAEDDFMSEYFAMEHKNVVIKKEVPTMGQRADLVAKIDDLIIVIEAKINHKKKVLEQCIAHYLVADYICIAWGAKNVPDSLKEKSEELGYGIIHCPSLDSQCRWDTMPVLNENFWEPQKRVLINNMESQPDVKY